MNGINTIGNGVRETGGADSAETNFDAVFAEQLGNTTAVMFQFLGADIIESVMKDERSVD